jgi:hypothetical protein
VGNIATATLFVSRFSCANHVNHFVSASQDSVDSQFLPAPHEQAFDVAAGLYSSQTQFLYSGSQANGDFSEVGMSALVACNDGGQLTTCIITLQNDIGVNRMDVYWNRLDGANFACAPSSGPPGHIVIGGATITYEVAYENPGL